ncbi:hypothetical protein [Oceanobacillus bengalensis]|uniref:Uncharacterized protein n=1 Tax=Oceanobacillus bengalensis TaxID=1435466 RepID=A0A494Z2T8_9BACI|nr:hypothetical protein [Oceanobacillus bengalensis]RKQ16828.1 hypothetical protein D8M05_06130 [Oceanobacillus bengalensis]
MLPRLLFIIPIIVGAGIIMLGLMLIITLTLNQPPALTYTLVGIHTFIITVLFGKLAKKIYLSF